MAKNDLFKKDWLDIVFAGRNKQYGAYKLRLESPRTTLLALGSGLCLFGLVFIVPTVISSVFEEDNGIAQGEIITCPMGVELTDLDIPEVKLIEDVLPPIEEEIAEVIEEDKGAAASVLDMERFTALEIAKPSEVTEEVAKQENLVEGLIGSESIKGNEEGSILVTEAVGTTVGGTGTEIKEDDGKEMENKVYRVTTESAEPREGLALFSKNFVSKFREINLPNATGGKVQVILSFVVEKDGSITDIKVMRDPGYGAGAEAVRVLKTMPKWKPARQDNRTVRSQFTLPITIQVQ